MSRACTLPGRGPSFALRATFLRQLPSFSSSPLRLPSPQLLSSTRRQYTDAASSGTLDHLAEVRTLAGEGQFVRASKAASAWFRGRDSVSVSPLEAETYATLIDVFARTKHQGHAFLLLREMEAHDLTPPLALYSSVVRASNRPDTISTATAIYDKLVDAGRDLDTQFYDAYIEALIGANLFKRANEIYNVMHTYKKLPITPATYKNIITIYGEFKRIDLVDRVLSRMATKNIPLEPMHHAATVLAVGKAVGIDAAFERVERMTTDRDKYPAPGVQVYEALLGACCLSPGTIDRCWRALRSMAKAGVKPTARTYNTILAAHIKFGRGHEADAVLQAMGKDGVIKTPHTYSLLMSAYAKSTNVAKAIELLKEQKAAGTAPRSGLYNNLLDALLQSVMSQVPREQLSADSASTKIAVTDAIAKADEVYKEMTETGVPLSSFTYSIMIQLQHLADNSNKAFELYEDMRRRGMKPGYSMVSLMGTIVAKECDRLEQTGQL